MRLLFGREFPFDDVLMMWDVLFAHGLRSDLVDFTCMRCCSEFAGNVSYHRSASY